jgi:hypothetical protein
VTQHLDPKGRLRTARGVTRPHLGQREVDALAIGVDAAAEECGVFDPADILRSRSVNLRDDGVDRILGLAGCEPVDVTG